MELRKIDQRNIRRDLVQLNKNQVLKKINSYNLYPNIITQKIQQSYHPNPNEIEMPIYNSSVSKFENENCEQNFHNNNLGKNIRMKQIKNYEEDNNYKNIKTVINNKFHEKLWLPKKPKKEFIGVFQCDSVDEVLIIDSDKIMKNTNSLVILGENDNKNGLFYQFFYLCFLSRKLFKDSIIFQTVIETLDKNIIELNNFPISEYTLKICDYIQNIYGNLKMDVSLSFSEDIKNINKIKKIPPEEMISLSRFICIYYRITIIAHLNNCDSELINKEYGITNIDKFIDSLYDLSEVYNEEEKIVKILFRIFNIPIKHFSQELNQNFIYNIELNYIFGIGKIIDESNKRSYYSIFSKNNNKLQS